MASYAVAFHSLFVTCNADAPDLVKQFGTFWSSLLFLFGAMLGNFEFDLFDAVDSCNRPAWAYDVSVWMLVLYEVIMAILLLNLLIAVLSTVHASVDENAEQEFYLTRAKLVVNVARAVNECRVPAPLNLFRAVVGLVIDFPYALWHAFVCLLRYAAVFRFCSLDVDVPCRFSIIVNCEHSLYFGRCYKYAFSLRRCSHSPHVSYTQVCIYLRRVAANWGIWFYELDPRSRSYAP